MTTTRSTQTVIGDYMTVDEHKPIQGISDWYISRPAYRWLHDYLESFGNTLSDDHCYALLGLLKVFTKVAQQQLQGRYAIAMPTGTGKTSAIIAWITALHKHKLENGRSNHISVAIAASKVEALCELKRDLIKNGVPESDIGLWHSYKHEPGKDVPGRIPEGYASEPATANHEDRPYLLITHNRVRQQADLKKFSRYKRRPRNLVIYDESLIKSDSRAISINKLRANIAGLSMEKKAEDSYKKFLLLLTITDQKLSTAIQNDTDSVIELLPFQELSDKDLSTLKGMIPNTGEYPHLEQFMDIASERLRISPCDGGGILSYEIAIPDELRNVVILDASYPIRQLCKLDATVKDAENSERTLKYFTKLKKPLSHLKSFENVTVHHMQAPGGRHSLTYDFKDFSERKAVSDVVEVIKQTPPDESVLVFVYKQRHKGINFERVLQDKLTDAGIDTDAKTPEGNCRINILTWGHETSTNSFSHCKHVILCGVLQRSYQDLASALIGQKDNLEHPFNNSDVHELKRHECAHLIYQAMSRGSCRVMKDGKAMPMHLWVIHADAGLRELLEPVLPDVQWQEWYGLYAPKKEPGVIDKVSQAILEYLKKTEDNRISTQRLKKEVQLEHINRHTFKDALHEAIKGGSGWALEKRSLCRVGSLF